jgi:hypothetical protein
MIRGCEGCKTMSSVKIRQSTKADIKFAMSLLRSCTTTSTDLEFLQAADLALREASECWGNDVISNKEYADLIAAVGRLVDR